MDPNICLVGYKWICNPVGKHSPVDVDVVWVVVVTFGVFGLEDDDSISAKEIGSDMTPKS